VCERQDYTLAAIWSGWAEHVGEGEGEQPRTFNLVLLFMDTSFTSLHTTQHSSDHQSHY